MSLLAVGIDASVTAVTVELAVGYRVSRAREVTTVTSILVFDNTQIMAFDSAHTG